MPVSETVVMTEGKRILFVIPWGERTIIGTTDTDYQGPLEDVRADTEDIAYVLKVTNQFFPGARLTERDVISSWAGLRPLVADPNGKLTTYRLTGEQKVDQIVERLGVLKGLNGRGQRCRTFGTLPRAARNSQKHAKITG